MKKIIFFLGIIFLALIIILNVAFTANLDAGEHITINFNNFIYVIGILFLSTLMIVGSEFLNKKIYNDNEKKDKKIKWIFIVFISIYILFTAIWTIVVRPPIIADQIHACNLAQTMYRDNVEEFLPNDTYAGIPLREYVQAYHQQISLAFVFSIFFKLIHFDGIGVLRVLNVIGNISIVIALCKIIGQLSKKYKINYVRFILLMITFVSLPMLSTFIYGDIPSLALCLFSVYFMMKYTETKKIRYPIVASIFTSIAYMMRMNSLIFIIATTIYLSLELFKEIKEKKWKDNLIKILIIFFYIAVSILPSSIVKNYYLNKYNMDKNKEYPNISYFLMAMEEGPRANGWYSEGIGEPALKNPAIKEEYAQRIKERLQFFSKNIGYTIDFYMMKITSMWAENTYSAVRQNTRQENDSLEVIIEPLTFYQKALLIVMCLCALIILIQNRKNLSLELILLVTIFVGGFTFHILWEAKSRYIIPYIVVLIPVAAVNMNKFNLEKWKEKLNIVFSSWNNK